MIGIEKLSASIAHFKVKEKNRDYQRKRIADELDGLKSDAARLMEALDHCRKCWRFKHFENIFNKNGNA